MTTSSSSSSLFIIRYPELNGGEYLACVCAYLIAVLRHPGHHHLTVQLIVDPQKRLIHFQDCGLMMVGDNWNQKEYGCAAHALANPITTRQVSLRSTIQTQRRLKVLHIGIKQTLKLQIEAFERKATVSRCFGADHTRM